MTALECILVTCAVNWFALDWYVLSHRWNDSTFYIGSVLWRKLAPSSTHMNGWPRLRRWLTDGPLPEIRMFATSRRPGCDCDGCYIDTCPTMRCRGAWVSKLFAHRM